MRAVVIGTGWGRVHVAALREAGVEVVAVVGLEEGRTRRAADELRVPVALTGVGEVAGLAPDLVSVATPAATHAEVIAALEPQVPVLCEKPAVGLGPLREEPANRPGPVWVNYSFAFLGVAARAADAVHRIGHVSRAEVVCGHDLPGTSFTAGQMFLELAPHPWSWLVTLLGPTRAQAPDPGAADPGAAGPRRARAAAHAERPDSLGDPGDPVATTRVSTLCGGSEVLLRVEHRPGLAGIRHDVTLNGSAGRLTLTGTYRLGEPWHYAAPLLDIASAPITLGEPEAGLPDPWYRANVRSIGAVVAAVRGQDASPLLFDWNRALDLDRAAQSGLTVA